MKTKKKCRWWAGGIWKFIRRREKREDAEGDETEQSDLVPPPKRRRLTLPFPDPAGESPVTEGGSVQRETCSQSQSSLFSLPPELRRQVYIGFFGSTLIYVMTEDRNPVASHSKPHLSPCLRSTNKPQWRSLSHLPDCCDGGRGRWHHIWYHSHIVGSPMYNPLALLRTCRRVYSEGIDLLYSENVFQFCHRTFQTLTLFSNTIPAIRLDCIQRLDLAWRFTHRPPLPDDACIVSSDVADWAGFGWTDLWKVVAGMKGLRECRVWCAMECRGHCRFRNCWLDGFQIDSAKEEQILTPLLAVGRPNLKKHEGVRSVDEDRGRNKSTGSLRSIKEGVGNSGESRKSRNHETQKEDSRNGSDGEAKNTNENVSLMSTGGKGEGTHTKSLERENGLDIFELRVPWWKGNVDWNAKGAPFKITYASWDGPCNQQYVVWDS